MRQTRHGGTLLSAGGGGFKGRTQTLLALQKCAGERARCVWLGGDWQVSEALTGMERQCSDVLCQNSELSYCKPAPDVNAAHVLPPPSEASVSWHGLADAVF